MIPALTGVLAPHGLATSFESIATVTVGSGGSSSLDFSSITGTYQHLQLRIIGRFTNASSGGTGTYIRLGNGSIDTGTNYTNHILYGTGSAAGTYTPTNPLNNPIVIDVIQGGSTANVFGVAIIDILDYSTTGQKYKTIRSLYGWDLNGSGTVALASASWMSTNPVTNISIFNSSLTFAQYSQAALYGVKA